MPRIILVVWLLVHASYAFAQNTELRTGYSFPLWGKTSHMSLGEIVYETSPLTLWNIYPTLEMSLGVLTHYPTHTSGVLSSVSMKWAYMFEHIKAYVGMGIGVHSLDALAHTHIGGPGIFRVHTGVSIPLSSTWDITVGYHHFSNAFLYPANQGIDMIMGSVRYVW
jgi:hypothetical protein